MTPPSPRSEGLAIRTYFVRHRNALLARADFGELYVEYYLHLARYGLRPDPDHDQLFKDALAAMTLHCATRPWNESVAWTINIQNPLLNIFVTGNNGNGAVTGQIFTEHVRPREGNLFCCDVVRGGEEPRRSVVEFKDADILPAVEHFYMQSEQRPARFLRAAEEDLVLVVAQPDCDLEWFASLKDETILNLDKAEELSLLEERHYQWECGCTQERMLEVLAPAHRDDPDALFGVEDVVRMSCPRCGGRHAITREALEAFLEQVDDR